MYNFRLQKLEILTNPPLDYIFFLHFLLTSSMFANFSKDQKSIVMLSIITSTHHQ